MDVSVRRTSLDELSAEGLERLIAADESLFVERKSTIPSEGLGPTMASLANTLGGWILLGVDDAGSVVGFAPPGRAGAQDYVRDLLRNEIDPLPSFVAKRFDYSEMSLVVIRVAESADTPHVTQNGVIYIREPGGKRPISDHRSLVELAGRGKLAEAQARERLLTLPLIEQVLGSTPDRIPGDPPGEGTPEPVEWIVRASPFTLTGNFANLALSEATADWAGKSCGDVFPSLGAGVPPPEVLVTAMARGIVARGRHLASSEVADLAVDAGGVIAARKARRRKESAVHLPGTSDDDLLPLLTATVTGLRRLDANGRAALSLQLRGVKDMAVFIQTTAAPLDIAELHLNGELAIPPDEGELASLADQWSREIGRAANLPLWEPP